MNKYNMGVSSLWQRIRYSVFVAPQKNFSFPEFRLFSIKLVLVTVVLTLAASCSGGGGESDATNNSSGNSDVTNVSSPAPAVDFVISGTVSAPNATIAYFRQKGFFAKLADAIFPPAHASGLSAGGATIPDGTQVELVRIDNAGVVISTLATTTTSVARYSFNLTRLGLSAASDLIVQVSNSSTGARMRAFVISNAVDINPDSETVVRIILGKSTALSLGNFTLQELTDVSAAVNLLVITRQLVWSSDIESTVVSLQSIIIADINFMAFVDSASLIGQTSEGVGDLVNYVPLTVGSTWVYDGNISTTGETPLAYTNTATVVGTKLVNNMMTVIYTETNTENYGANEDYLFKDNQALIFHGNDDPSDLISQQLAPYPLLTFPFRTLGTYEKLNRSGLDLGEDIDGDGVNERVNVVSSGIAQFEGVTVAAGTFPNCAKLEDRIEYIITLSSDSSNITVVKTVTRWLAPGVGIVRRWSDTVIPDTGFREITDEGLRSYTVL